MQDERKLDIESLIGWMLIGLIFIGFTWYNHYIDNYNFEKNTNIINNKHSNGRVIFFNKKSNKFYYTPISKLDSNLMIHNNKFSIENDKIKINIKLQGGQIDQVKLKKYSFYNKILKKHQIPLYLINKNDAQFGFTFKLKNGKLCDTRMLFFEKVKHDKTILFLRTKVEDVYINFYYKLKQDYSLEFNFSIKEISKISLDQIINFDFKQRLRLLEKGFYQENSYTEINYSYNNFSQDDYWSNKSFQEKEKVDWVAFKQQFFATVLESTNKFVNLKGTSKNFQENSQFLKEFSISSHIKSSDDMNEKIIWYFFPLDRDYLKTFNKNFEKLIPFGWGIFGWLNVFFLSLYKFLNNLGISAGWIILFMTIIVKMITAPIMYKQFKQSAMMRVLFPELEEINEKHKNSNSIKKQHAIMDLYRKAGLNPMAGCLPALLQMPLFIALYRFFPNIIDLRGKHFFWADDLTAYDSICSLPFSIPIYGDHISLFTILYCIVLLIYTRMTSGNMQRSTQEGIPDMKILMYIMPLMFIFILNSLASGLSFYYFVSNTLSIFIILFINKFLIDEKEIREKIQKNKSKKIKQGKWQQKMQQIINRAQEQKKIDYDV